MLAACVLAVLLIPAAQATPGALDPSFGNGGKVTTAFGNGNEYAYALLRQPDGKFVAAGSGWNGSQQAFALARYNPNGSLDTGFNGTGKVTTTTGPGAAEVWDLARQPDGKLIAAGDSDNGSNYDFALARYNADGSLDTGFNGTGKVTTPIGPGHDRAFAVALQPDGKVVVAGFSFNGIKNDFALARYNADGSLDTGFNGTGKVTTGFGSGADEARGLVVQPNGKLVVAGSSWNGTQDVFALARYNPNGSLDTSFNGTGKVTTPIGFWDAGQVLAIQPDGKLVVAGTSYDGKHWLFALARYNPNGSLDTSFKGTGKVTTAFGTNDVADALALQPDGKLVAAGFSWNGSRDVFALARYDTNGSLDPTFGAGGKLTTSLGSEKDDAYAVALQPDGKLVAAGYTTKNLNTDFALVRYLGSTLAVAKTGSGSGSVTSSPSGINCGSVCSVPLTTTVTLTATASAGSSFAGWSGACSGTGSCIVATGGDRTATARFETNKTLTLAKAGSGTGTVSSAPAGISCGSACAHVYRHGTAVTLTAIASPGSSFLGWSGACSGTGTCTVAMSANRSASARFETNKTLALTKTGRGAGTVSSSPAGISCGSSCAHAFRHGTAVTLTAAATARSRFAGWSGACAGTGKCTLTMSAARSVTATFKVLCVVPKLKGKTLRAAKRALRKAHCTPGKVTKAFSAKVKKGRVLVQQPRPGKKLVAGSRVRLKVSKGKQR